MLNNSRLGCLKIVQFLLSINLLKHQISTSYRFKIQTLPFIRIVHLCVCVFLSRAEEKYAKDEIGKRGWNWERRRKLKRKDAKNERHSFLLSKCQEFPFLFQNKILENAFRAHSKSFWKQREREKENFSFLSHLNSPRNEFKYNSKV